MSGIIDTNVYLSRWPFRRLKFDETPVLVAKLRKENVTQAWAGTFDGILHKDIASANERLAEECHKFGRNVLVPFGSVNLHFPNWEDDVRRCHEQHKMPGIRLHPNYHGYKLDEPVFAKLLKMAAERDLIVQIAAMMEDRRTQHPLIQLAATDLNPLAKVVKQTPNLRIHLLNAMQVLRGQPLLNLMASGEVYFEIATLEGVGGVGNLISQIPLSRVFFGSYAPFFIFESAKLKMKESPLSETQSRAILFENAKKFLTRA
jgi:predicted TIM-barrel fold metal-dependent hydrolase